MLAHHLRHRAGKRRLPGEHVPERDAERIDVRPGIDFLFLELLRAGEMRRADEAAHAEGGGVFAVGGDRGLGQAEVDDLGDQLVVFFDEHEIRRLDVAMHEPVLRGGIEGAGHLRR